MRSTFIRNAKRRLGPAGLAARILAGSVILLTAACSSQMSLYKQGYASFFFPEDLPDTIPVSPPLSQLGAIYGHVQDPNGNPLPGARITDGAAVTLASDGQYVFPTREYNATDDPNVILGVDGATLSAGDFVLDGLPLGNDTLTVSFDEVKTTVPVFVDPSSFSAVINPKLGITPPNYGASYANPETKGTIVVPFYRAVAGSQGVRAAEVDPPSIEGLITLASGSSPVVSWPSGSKVAVVLRVTPPANAAIQIASASILYEDDAGTPLFDPTNSSAYMEVVRNIAPEVTVLPGTSKTSGPPAAVVLDLATSMIASDDVAAAVITFPATDPQNHTLQVTVPIHMAVTGTNG